MSLESALSFIRKEIKDTSVRPLSEFPDIKVKVIDSQSIIFNTILGRGGWPKGHMVEIFGGENVGKTTLCYHAIAEEQKRGGVCAMVDFEHRVDPAYAAALGVDNSKLIFDQPAGGEAGIELIYQMLLSGDIDLIVVDSVDAIRPRQEAESDWGKAVVGKHAVLIGDAVREFTKIKGDTCVIFTNQIRENPGKMFGNPEYTPGGRAIKFYVSIRIELRKGDFTQDAAENNIGNIVKVKCLKNSVAPPFRTGEIKLVYGIGIDKIEDVLHSAILAGLIIKKGSFYKLIIDGKETNLGQGEANTLRWLAEKDRAEKLRRFVVSSKWYQEAIGIVKASKPSTEGTPVTIREDEEAEYQGEGLSVL